MKTTSSFERLAGYCVNGPLAPAWMDYKMQEKKLPEYLKTGYTFIYYIPFIYS